MVDVWGLECCVVFVGGEVRYGRDYGIFTWRTRYGIQ